MMVEDLGLGRWFVCSSAHVVKKNRAFFSYCIFATIVRGKITPELYHSRQFPARAWKKKTSELLEITFSSFLSLSALFFRLFVFFSFSFTFFHHSLQNKNKKAERYQKWRKKRLCFFMSEKGLPIETLPASSFGFHFWWIVNERIIRNFSHVLVGRGKVHSSEIVDKFNKCTRWFIGNFLQTNLWDHF